MPRGAGGPGNQEQDDERRALPRPTNSHHDDNEDERRRGSEDIKRRRAKSYCIIFLFVPLARKEVQVQISEAIRIILLNARSFEYSAEIVPAPASLLFTVVLSLRVRRVGRHILTTAAAN